MAVLWESAPPPPPPRAIFGRIRRRGSGSRIRPDIIVRPPDIDCRWRIRSHAERTPSSHRASARTSLAAAQVVWRRDGGVGAMNPLTQIKNTQKATLKEVRQQPFGERLP